MSNFSRPRSFKVSALPVCLLVLSACNNNLTESSAITDGESALILPKALQRVSTSIKNNLKASLTVNGGSPVAMTITGDTMTATVAKPDNEATYKIDIDYNDTSSSTVIPILSASKSTSAESVSFTEADFQFAHGDNDTYTNLREIEADRDPFDPASLPGDDNFEENTTFLTAYDLTNYDGQNLLERGVLFDDPSLRTDLNFNYTSAGLLAPNATDVYSMTVDEDKSSYEVIVKFFKMSDRSLGEDTQTALLDDMSFVEFSLTYPDSSTADNFSTFQHSLTSCVVRTEFNLSYFRCSITHEFSGFFTTGVLYPRLRMKAGATNFVEYSISWASQ